jgi:hypothetical protein
MLSRLTEKGSRGETREGPLSDVGSVPSHDPTPLPRHNHIFHKFAPIPCGWHVEGVAKPQPIRQIVENQRKVIEFVLICTITHDLKRLLSRHTL